MYKLIKGDYIMKTLQNTNAVMSKKVMQSYKGSTCNEIILSLNNKEVILSHYINFNGKLNTPKSIMHRALTDLTK